MNENGYVRISIRRVINLGRFSTAHKYETVEYICDMGVPVSRHEDIMDAKERLRLMVEEEVETWTEETEAALRESEEPRAKGKTK
jgi:hypothetical protein